MVIRIDFRFIYKNRLFWKSLCTGLPDFNAVNRFQIINIHLRILAINNPFPFPV